MPQFEPSFVDESVEAMYAPFERDTGEDPNALHAELQQTMSSLVGIFRLESDLEQALELGPDHLSCYNLTFEAGTALDRERRQGRVQPNDGNLLENGYLQPVASAGPSFHAAINKGKFHGMIWPTTPTGSRTV